MAGASRSRHPRRGATTAPPREAAAGPCGTPGINGPACGGLGRGHRHYGRVSGFGLQGSRRVCRLRMPQDARAAQATPSQEGGRSGAPGVARLCPVAARVRQPSTAATGPPARPDSRPPPGRRRGSGTTARRPPSQETPDTPAFVPRARLLRASTPGSQPAMALPRPGTAGAPVLGGGEGQGHRSPPRPPPRPGQGGESPEPASGSLAKGRGNQAGRRLPGSAQAGRPRPAQSRREREGTPAICHFVPR